MGKPCKNQLNLARYIISTRFRCSVNGLLNNIIVYDEKPMLFVFAVRYKVSDFYLEI